MRYVMYVGIGLNTQKAGKVYVASPYGNYTDVLLLTDGKSIGLAVESEVVDAIRDTKLNRVLYPELKSNGDGFLV